MQGVFTPRGISLDGRIATAAKASGSSTGWWKNGRGRAAARAMLRIGDRYRLTHCFFRSQRYVVPINYVGHASDWDVLDIEGDVRVLATTWFSIAEGEKVHAVASIYRDVDNVVAEISMERG